jgi:hypothetical protein
MEFRLFLKNVSDKERGKVLFDVRTFSKNEVAEVK